VYSYNTLERFELTKLIDFWAAVAGDPIVEDGVDYGEDGGGGADAESQGEDAGQSETGTFAEFAAGERRSETMDCIGTSMRANHY
jgi:hypothetical protein